MEITLKITLADDGRDADQLHAYICDVLWTIDGVTDIEDVPEPSPLEQLAATAEENNDNA